MQIIPDVTNITQIRKNATGFFRSVAKSNAPRWVSIDSTIQAVVLSPKAYEDLVLQAQPTEQDGISLLHGDDPDHALLSRLILEDAGSATKTWPALKQELKARTK